MGTLSTELVPHAERLSPRPRIYADANVPAGLVAHMRGRLRWDVLFVLEQDDLRRAPDVKHYQLAQQLRRTLVTMDRDYLDDRRFPPSEGAGVLVINAPDERQLSSLLDRVDAALFQDADQAWLVTTDANLEKVARVEGADVLNVAALANLLRPAVLGGEVFEVRLVRGGDEPGQGVGFLEDGTMVVVEGARARVGQTVRAEATNVLQTSAGRLVFAKLV